MIPNIYHKNLTAGETNALFCFRQASNSEPVEALNGFDLIIVGPVKMGVTTGNSNKGWSVGSGNDPSNLYSYLNVGIGTGNPSTALEVAGAATFTQFAGVTALEDGEDFIKQQITRYKKARDLVYQRLSSNPRIRMGWPEGAFYAFPSIKQTGLTSAEFEAKAMNEAGVALLSGSAFGEYGEGYVRLYGHLPRDI